MAARHCTMQLWAVELGQWRRTARLQLLWALLAWAWGPAVMRRPQGCCCRRAHLRMPWTAMAAVRCTMLQACVSCSFGKRLNRPHHSSTSRIALLPEPAIGSLSRHQPLIVSVRTCAHLIRSQCCCIRDHHVWKALLHHPHDDPGWPLQAQGRQTCAISCCHRACQCTRLTRAGGRPCSGLPLAAMVR